MRPPLEPAELERLARLLEACWRSFDRTAGAAEGRPLRKGPRGGGREREAIVRHVLEAEEAYLAKLGGTRPAAVAKGTPARMGEVRKRLLSVLAIRARGGPPPCVPRSGSLWTPRYGIRRSAWHALDHAWEIEDRVEPALAVRPKASISG
jgi:hypothetical protein